MVAIIIGEEDEGSDDDDEDVQLSTSTGFHEVNRLLFLDFYYLIGFNFYLKFLVLGYIYIIYFSYGLVDGY